MVTLISSEEAAALVQDHSTIVFGGFGAYGAPDLLLDALGKRFQKSGSPVHLTSVSGISTGNHTRDLVGMNRIAYAGMFDTIIAAHFGNAPLFGALAASNEVAAYALPLGVVMNLFRAVAAKKPGVLTSVGLGTYADPRNEACIINDKARAQKRQVVQLLELNGQEQLFYPSFPIHMCFIRGTCADKQGNISISKEALVGAELEIAAAVHNCGGTVIVQVETRLEKELLPAQAVRIHHSLVDHVVVAPAEMHQQGYASDAYRPELTGASACSTTAIEPMPLTVRKVIARRAAQELRENCVINLGIGMPSGIASVAHEEGISALLSLESGPIGGVPLEGMGFAAAVAPEARLTQCDVLDLYDGGYLDMAFLGAAEIDIKGNVNVSKFGARCTGPGGFVDITQNTPKVFFVGTFTAGKTELSIRDGQLDIRSDGSGIKFVQEVQQICFSADYALQSNQEVQYITERAVFRLTKDGLLLTEIAPGIDLNKDILDKMGFRPLIADDLKRMNARLFQDGKTDV